MTVCMNTLFSSITSSFTQELQDAQSGKKTSLPFIRHEYLANKATADGEVFQVLVIGGSVYKSALIKKRGNTFVTLEKFEGRQPIFKTKEDFLTFAASKIDPGVTLVGINFAFPLTPFFRDGYLDGKLGFGTKEHAFEGLIGETVGEAIEEAVFKTFNKKVRVGIANDTICLLLSGLTRYFWNQVAAGIVGTGLNFALFLDDHTPVNLEAANFNKFTQSKEAAIVDKRSMTPGNAWAEKEVSGAYLHQLFNEGIRLRGLQVAPIASTDQIDEIAKNESGEAKTYALELLERSAGIVAAEIAGITGFLKRDTAFVMEGSLFWKGYGFKDKVEQFVREILPEYSVSYIYIPDSGIMGAAKLVA